MAAVAIAFFLASCGGAPNNRAAVVLIDISGEYAHEMEKARRVTSYLLGSLEPGDSIAVAFIDNTSYTERNFIARADFDHRPSVANDQKRQVKAKLDAFLKDFDVPSYHSDLTGGILLARDYLESAEAKTRQIFLLSDLDEDLKPELDRDVPLTLGGIEVVAVNVIRRDSDNVDPKGYRKRIAGWQERVQTNGGHWQMVNQIERLERVVALR
ncbi:VWA domain-containing protein [Ectothiorhodospiraceae bacterium WFHF3C12]|nr:VWA domain-containing protein [Ectothiorhodospiraceae bacterium WFHF3C12]